MNLHTSIFFRMIKLGVESFKPTTPPEIPLPSMPPGQHATIPVTTLGLNIKVLKKDEDERARPEILRKLIRFNNWVNPVIDTNKPWSSLESGKQSIQSVFGDYFPKSRVDWNGVEPTSDQALRWWMFSGLGALELQRLDGPAAEGERVQGIAPEFVSSYEFLKDLPVRPGLASYGGAVYADKNGNILKIKLRGKDVFPSDGKAWEHAKFTYRSSSLVWVTVYHHLFFSHYSVSNSGVLATLYTLPVDNPLRMLLKPFLFRTTAINIGGVDSLLPKGSSIYRALGFTWPAMEEAFGLMMKKIAVTPLPEQLRAQGLDSESLQGYPEDLFPYGRDGMDYWNTLNQFTHTLLHQGPAFKGVVQNDAIKAWWDAINGSLRYAPRDLNADNLAVFLTQFLYTVSAFHSWVGHVTPYVMDPSVAAGKIFPEATLTDQQNSAELGVIASITGLPMPSLLGDFSHLMPDEHAKASLRQLHEGLVGVGREIAERNTRRAIALNTFLPEEMNLSVAI